MTPLNIHLLKFDCTTDTYTEWLQGNGILDERVPDELIPPYLFARCPLCLSANVERINTNSIHEWRVGYGMAVFDSRLIIHHCEHFVLVQPFFHFHGIWPQEARGMLTQEAPHLIGHLLESSNSLAVIHALPICRIETNTFVPRYTLFMVSYFSVQPKKAYDSVIAFNVDYVEEGIAWPFIAPPDGCEHWWDLTLWVSRGKLYWVDSYDPELGIVTQNISDFPYGDITGRTWPYLHTFPFPLPTRRKENKRTKP